MKTTSIEVLKQFVKTIGLDQDGTQVDVSESARTLRGYTPGEGNFVFQLSIPITVDVLSTSHPVMKVFREIQDRIAKSPLVQIETDRLQRKIKEQEVLIQARDLELEELRQYKAHFDVEMKLRHGEKDDE